MDPTPPVMPALGARAPDFALPDTRGNPVALAEFAGAPATVVIFLCADCPHVEHVKTALVEFAYEYATREVAVIGIDANDADDAETEREAGRGALAGDIAEFGYAFPYLIDATQETAKAYGAECTPDFFVFDRDLRLVYRGQFDDSRPDRDAPATGRDLRAAVDTVLAGQTPAGTQKPATGSAIRWKPGNAPDSSG